MRVLVTGGAGFIGSAIVDRLVADGCEVVVLDSLLAAAHAALPGYLNPAAQYVWADLRNADALASCLEGVNAVSHQAAMVGMGVNFDDAPEYVRNNDLATATLLGGLSAAGFRGRLVLAGSMVVYGEGRYRCPVHGLVGPGPRSPARLMTGRFEPQCPHGGSDLVAEEVPESAAPDPRSVYAATKLHQEQLCACFSRERGAALTVLRYHNVYGPRMPSGTLYAGVAAIFRSALAAGRPVRVFEDGGQRRDFVQVDDVARANVLALADTSGTCHVCNIASGAPATVLEMATALAGASAGPAPPVVVTGEYRVADVRHVFAAVEHAQAVLGFRARVMLADGMRDFVTAPLR
ncbi:MAG: NAD-dependent epimerase/dehydratase family protein [Actinomycetota bacterium]